MLETIHMVRTRYKSPLQHVCYIFSRRVFSLRACCLKAVSMFFRLTLLLLPAPGSWDITTITIMMMTPCIGLGHPMHGGCPTMPNIKMLPTRCVPNTVATPLQRNCSVVGVGKPQPFTYLSDVIGRCHNFVYVALFSCPATSIGKQC